MMVNKIKIRLSILILSLITIISIMTISISGEVKKISAASEDYKDKLIRFHVIKWINNKKRIWWTWENK